MAKKTIVQEPSLSTPPVIQQITNPVTIRQDDTTPQRTLSQQISPQTILEENSIVEIEDNSKHNSTKCLTSNKRILTRAAKRAMIQQRTIIHNMATPSQQNRIHTAKRYLHTKRSKLSAKPTKPTHQYTTRRKTHAKQQSSEQTTQRNNFDKSFDLNETLLNKPSKQELQLDEHGNFCQSCVESVLACQ